MFVGVDVGGTFTDFVGVRDGELVTWKGPSTPTLPDRAVADGLHRLGATSMAHGTTVATNAIIERKGARIVLLTTVGFEDVLEIGRQSRPSLYDFRAIRAPSVVPRGMSIGVRERIGPTGRVLKGLSKAEITRVLRKVRRRGAESVAVCLLFSFLNPRHERALKAAIASRHEASISLEVLPEFREYERASTTALDAYIKPLVRRHLTALEGAIGSRFLAMKSGGGTADSHEVLSRPIDLALSGPAGGVSAALSIAKALRIRNLVTFDMGGTSADFSVVLDGRPTYTGEASVGGLPIALPVVDIVSMGAGGGSVAWMDRGGALRVGPMSAGAEPGPLCYGRGGREPTVTDADLIAGLLPDALLGGTMPLRRDLAAKGLRGLADRLHLPLDDAILGVRQVVDATMVRGIKTVLARRGLDPRDFALLSFGGAGPVHAAFLAREIGLRRILVPFLPGSFCAYGVLTADIRLDFSRGLVAPLRHMAATSARVLREVRATAERAVRRHGFPSRAATYTSSVDLRFAGQSYEINVPFGRAMEAAFRREHRRRYGYASRTEAIELVALRLVAVIPGKTHLPKAHVCDAPPSSQRRVLFNEGWRTVDVWRRPELGLGFEARGPAILEEDQATTVIPPGGKVVVRRHGILDIEVE